MSQNKIMFLFLLLGVFFLVMAFRSRQKIPMPWRSVDTVLKPRVKNPYHPVETGYTEMLLRRIPQFFYKRGTVVGDVSPLNPIPYVAVVPERRNLNMTEFGFANIDPGKQAALIDEKFNQEEHPRFTQTYRTPIGKQSWRRHNVKYADGFIET